jgi:hypothetical protein
MLMNDTDIDLDYYGLDCLKRENCNYQMADTVEEVKAEGPGNAHLCAEEDGGSELVVLK